LSFFNSAGESLEIKTMDLGPYSNNQINQVFGGHLLGHGYVDVWAGDLDALYTCYGSMLDNSTSDPTTILPQVPSDSTTFIPAAAFAAGLEAHSSGPTSSSTMSAGQISPTSCYGCPAGTTTVIRSAAAPSRSRREPV